MLATLVRPRVEQVRGWRRLSSLGGDALLYALSALFALGLALTSSQPAQWHWGYLAVGTYAVAALLAAGGARWRWRRDVAVRSALVGLVMLGAVAMPLALEARWRQVDHLSGYAQPEVSVIERAGQSLSRGQDPYHTYLKNGHLVGATPGIPSWQSFFPYFPLMGVFGLPSADAHEGRGLTDARIVMSLMTLLVSLGAILALTATRERKLRVIQVLLALPTGALFLATGGDDMPILALALLGVVALQRRWWTTAGIALGLAAAMKLTAWPVAALAIALAGLWGGRRAIWRVATPLAVIVVGTVAPFAIRSPRAFLSNVFAFPLGLAGVQSPAASPLPGHILSTLWHPSAHVLPPVALAVGAVVGWRWLRRHRPLDLARGLNLLAVAFVVAICVASATRIGYVIYPINFAIWAWVLAERTPSAPLAG